MTSADIKRKALELGFDACGIAPAADLPELRFFREWLDRGYAGEMGYLHRSADRRADVRRVVSSAKSVIVTATVYNVDRPYSTECADPRRAQIARYAWGDDYHDVLGRRLDRLLEWMRAESSDPFDALAYVDTGPIQERVYARHAGIGWIGKNTCVINPGLGSWILLAEIVCSLLLEADQPALDQCGTCTLCLDACPTGAFIEPHVLDATRCISYLTIEYRGEIPQEHHAAVGNHVFGCDICQEVCPWNAMPATANPTWPSRGALSVPRLAELSARTDEQLAELIRGTPLARAGVNGLRRNITVALTNFKEGAGRGSAEL